MRIDNPISTNAIITGSFTGSFKGDGSQLTGIEHPSIPAGVVSGSEQIVISDTTGYSTLNDAVTLNTAKISFDAASSSKLDGIEANATADQSAAEIKTAYESNADTNEFSDAEKSKLAALEAGATGDQTGAEIKALYEAEADTNAFDDAAVSKLAGIEAGATGDQTAAEIRAAVEAATDSNVFTDADHTKLNGIEAGATNDTAALSSLDTRVTDVEGDVAAILTGADADKDSFAEIVTLINSVDTTNDSALGAHVANTSNPHSVTKAQVGLGNVDNTSDADKPISTATQTALNAKQAAGTYNTIIGTDTDLNTAGAEVVDQINVTDGVIQSMSKRTLTLANLGYTGATNANYITNNNQLTNGAGYTTNVGDITSVGAGNGLTGGGSSGAVTLNVVAGNGLSVAADSISMSGTYTGNFTATGDISAYSDSRLKKDVKTIEGALDKTKELRGVEFTRIADDTKSIGVIAQELEAVLPELVLTDDEGMKSVNYAQITGLLIEAVKELSAKVDELSK